MPHELQSPELQAWAAGFPLALLHAGSEPERQSLRREVISALRGAVPALVAAGLTETTVQWSGAVTVKVNVALRSGCSKTAKTRRESATSNWE